MNHLKTVIFIVVLFVICLLFIGWFLRSEVFHDLLPFQERVISTKTTADGKYRLNAVCKQKILAVDVYLDIENLLHNGDPVRSFVAERDVVQDCDSFVIDRLEPTTEDGILAVNFLGSRRVNIEIP